MWFFTEQQFNEQHKKLIQAMLSSIRKKNKTPKLLDTPTTMLQIANKPIRNSKNHFEPLSSAEKSTQLLCCGDIRPCRAFYTDPCRGRALEFAAHEDWLHEFLGLPLLWKDCGGALEPQELLTPVSEAEPQRQLHPELIVWSKNDHPFSSISFQRPLFNACFVKIWKSQF